MRFILAATVVAIALTSVQGQSIGFVPAAPVFCKFEPGRRLESERTPPPLEGLAVPVYAKAPERDFWMLGELMINGAGTVHDTAEARSWGIEQLALAAKARGADAIWLVTPFAGRFCQAIAIRWQR